MPSYRRTATRCCAPATRLAILIDCPSMSSTRSRIWTESKANGSIIDLVWTAWCISAVNLRGMVQSDARVFHTEMQDMLRRGLPVCIHASQTHPNSDDAADYEKRGYLGSRFLFCHYIAATDSDRAAMARTNTSLSFSTHSELRLGEHGDPRIALMKARAARVSVTL